MAYQRSEEGKMRDQMNGIVRDKDGNIISRYGKPLEKVGI